MKKPKKPKKTKATAAGEAGEVTEKKKGGKKKLLILIPIVLLLVAAVAAAAVIFVLPRFGINLLGEKEPSLEEPLPKKGLEVYSIGEVEVEGEEKPVEDTVPALDTLLLAEEEDEEAVPKGKLVALRSPDSKAKAKKDDDSDDSEEAEDDQYIYIYELDSYAEMVNQYVNVLTGSEGFEMTDETFLVLEETPEVLEEGGYLRLVRPALEEGHLFQVTMGWSQNTENLVLRVSSPTGKISYPKKEEPEKSNITEPSSVSLQMEQLRSMTPAHLGLPGDSMDTYTIYPVDGFVKVDGIDCRRFNVYNKNSGSIAGTYLFSVDQQHIYVLEPSSNTVSTIK